jgi:hypothetical protein
MARTISTALNGQLLLSASDSPLTITGAGSVAVTTSDAISSGSDTAWQVLNSGSISATASSAAGIYFAGSGWSVQNSGEIQGGSAGVYASGGGAVTNNVGGLISGGSNYGVYISGGPDVVSNAGTITGGWLAVNFAFNSASNRLVAAPGAVFNGLVRGGAGTLELAAPVAGGPSAGSIGGLSTTTSGTFQNFQTLTVDAGAAWTLTGANTITNIIDNGSLVVTGALPAANIQIGQAATLEVASAPATPSPIVFASGALKSTLKIDNYATFGANVGGSSYSGPLLENFGAGDTIDIANLSAAGATLSYSSATGLLQITNGTKVASLSFQNASLSGAFALSSDGGTGVYLTTGSLTEALVADTGSSSTDGVTNNAALTGTAAAGSTVTLSEGATTLGAATANASGVWTFTPTTLSQGAHTILASTASGSASLTFTYDTVAPAVTEAFVNGALTGTGDPNAQVTLSDGGVALGATTANASGAWTYTPTSLSVGPHTVVATETDSAGNSESAPLAFDITTPAVPAYSHIVVVVEENKNYDEIIGNTSQAPYLNNLASNGALLTDFTATLHPSQPNYFDLYAGSTFGITDDGSYQEPGPTLYNTLTSAGLSFKGYVDEAGGSDFNHDPWVSFPEGRSVQTDFSSFPALFPQGDYSSLPTISFVIPGVDNDMHNGTVQQGDSWLQTNLSSYAQWAKANNSLLVVVWDESDDESATVTADPNNIVPAILYGANIIPGQYNAPYGFENLLSTITHSYGLTAPNNAASASPITGMFANTHPG